MADEKEQPTDLVPVHVHVQPQPNQLAVPIKLDFDELKKFVADKSFTDAEVETYLQVCEHNRIDPFKKEAHIARIAGKVTFLTGYIVYVKRAGLTGKLDGWSCVVDDEKNPTKATLTVHRKDWKEPFVWITYRSEVAFATAKGGSRYERASHKAMPCLMLKKCAISAGFPLAFADFDLGGLPYILEEMENASYTVVDEAEDGFPENLPKTPEEFRDKDDSQKVPAETKEENPDPAASTPEGSFQAEADDTTPASDAVDDEAAKPTNEAEDKAEEHTEPPDCSSDATAKGQTKNQRDVDRAFCCALNAWLNVSDDQWKKEVYEKFEISSRTKMTGDMWTQYRVDLMESLDPQQKLRYENNLSLYKMLMDLQSAGFKKQELELYLKVRFATSILIPSNRDVDVAPYVKLLSKMAQTDQVELATQSIKTTLAWVEKMGKNNIKALLYDLDMVRGAFIARPYDGEKLLTGFYKRMMITPKDNIFYLIDIETTTQFKAWSQTLIGVCKGHVDYFNGKGKTEPSPDAEDDEVYF